MNLIRVLIVDDSPTFCAGLWQVLGKERDLTVIAEARTGEEAVVTAQQRRPDVVLMDIIMPGMDGITATRQIIEQCPATAIIMMSGSYGDLQIFTAVKNGARGCLVKDAEAATIVTAIRTVARGEAVLDSQTTARVLREFQRIWSPPGLSVATWLDDRQVLILRLITEGCSNKAIGLELHLAEKTIKNAVHVIFQKLQVTDRAAAAAYTVRHNLTADSHS